MTQDSDEHPFERSTSFELYNEKEEGKEDEKIKEDDKKNRPPLPFEPSMRSIILSSEEPPTPPPLRRRCSSGVASPGAVRAAPLPYDHVDDDGSEVDVNEIKARELASRHCILIEQQEEEKKGEKRKSGGTSSIPGAFQEASSSNMTQIKSRARNLRSGSTSDETPSDTKSLGAHDHNNHNHHNHHEDEKSSSTKIMKSHARTLRSASNPATSRSSDSIPSTTTRNQSAPGATFIPSVEAHASTNDMKSHARGLREANNNSRHHTKVDLEEGNIKSRARNLRAANATTTTPTFRAAVSAPASVPASASSAPTAEENNNDLGPKMENAIPPFSDNDHHYHATQSIKSTSQSIKSTSQHSHQYDDEHSSSVIINNNNDADSTHRPPAMISAPSSRGGPFAMDAQVVPTSTEEDQEIINEDNAKGWKVSSKTKCYLTTFIIGLVVAIVVGASVTLTRNQNTPHKTMLQTSSIAPTPAPIQIESILQSCFNSSMDPYDTTIFDRIRQSLLLATTTYGKNKGKSSNNNMGSVINDTQFDIPNTTQRKSLCWLSLIDQSSLLNQPLLERFTLAVLYYELSTSTVAARKPFGTNHGWLEASSDHCKWVGVGCTSLDSETDVVSLLELEDVDLDGSLPKETGNLVYLERLDLSKNYIIGPIPTEIGYLKRLRKLHLDDNMIQGSFDTQIPDAIYDLNIIEFNVKANKLTGSIPDRLSSLSNLEKLELATNQLEGSLPSWLGDLYKLEKISFFSNRFTGSIPSTFDRLTSLEQLLLNLNRLDGTIPPFLGSLTNLVFLRLNFNRFEGTIPSELGNLMNAQGIELNNNDLIGTIPPSFGNLTNAATLWFKENDLTGEMPPSVCHLRDLELERLNADCEEVGCSPDCCTECSEILK